MALVSIALAHKKAGFFDPNTKVYLTAQHPMADLDISDRPSDVSFYYNIVRELLSYDPSLILCSGEIPESILLHCKKQSFLPISLIATDELTNQKAHSEARIHILQEPTFLEKIDLKTIDVIANEIESTNIEDEAFDAEQEQDKSNLELSASTKSGGYKKRNRRRS